LLERAGATVDTPDSGCCGMAGAWGYERGHYDVSVACAERALLPAVRDAAPQTLIVTNGFSCRSQIEQLGPGRRALHVAQALRLAGDGSLNGVARYPERIAGGRVARPSRAPATRMVVAGAAG